MNTNPNHVLGNSTKTPVSRHAILSAIVLLAGAIALFLNQIIWHSETIRQSVAGACLFSGTLAGMAMIKNRKDTLPWALSVGSLFGLLTTTASDIADVIFRLFF